MRRQPVPLTPGDLVNRQLGTDDNLIGTPDAPTLFGDAGGSMLDFSKGGNDTFDEIGLSNYTFYGDVVGSIFDFAQGGDDTFNGLPMAGVTAYGDAGADMSDHSKGGNDTFLSGTGRQQINTFFGDAGG
ncbi:hypothetical protein OWC48_31650, partial [Bradyrhizobium sp. Arg816]|nr:hypothetical protein [Bradyrhizobium sp. Arg816]